MKILHLHGLLNVDFGKNTQKRKIHRCYKQMKTHSKKLVFWKFLTKKKNLTQKTVKRLLFQKKRLLAKFYGFFFDLFKLF